MVEYNSQTNGEQFEAAALNRHLPLYPYFLEDLHNAYGKSFDNADILEVGSGPGFMLELFSRTEANRITGADISCDMLERAAKRCGRASLVQASVTELPFSDNSFDIIFSRGSVFFWEPLEVAFKELYRVSKNNSLVFVGGGYGLSTPDEVVAKVKALQNKDEKKSIPKLNPQMLADLAEKSGGKAEILAAKGRGFWLKWDVVK